MLSDSLVADRGHLSSVASSPMEVHLEVGRTKMVR